MTRTERVLFLGVAGLALTLSAGAYVQSGAGSVAVAQSAAGQRLATCDVYKAADLLMRSDRFKPLIDTERRRSEQALRDLEPQEKELKDMSDRLAAFPPDTKDPAARDLATLFQQKREAYLQTRQKVNDDFENFTTQKNFEAYRLVVDASRAVAERKGFTHVAATRLIDDSKPPETGLGFTMRLLARPLVVGPAADDLTPDVLKELKIEDVKPADAKPSATPTTMPKR